MAETTEDGKVLETESGKVVGIHVPEPKRSLETVKAHVDTYIERKMAWNRYLELLEKDLRETQDNSTIVGRILHNESERVENLHEILDKWCERYSDMGSKVFKK